MYKLRLRPIAEKDIQGIVDYNCCSTYQPQPKNLGETMTSLV